jgi:hypothetical protein
MAVILLIRCGSRYDLFQPVPRGYLPPEGGSLNVRALPIRLNGTPAPIHSSSWECASYRFQSSLPLEYILRSKPSLANARQRTLTGSECYTSPNRGREHFQFAARIMDSGELSPKWVDDKLNVEFRQIDGSSA